MMRRRGMPLDPRTLLLMAFCYAALAIAFIEIRELAALAGIGICLTWLVGGTPWRTIASVRRLAGVLVAIALAQSIFELSGDPLFAVRGVTVLTTNGIRDGAAFLLRATAVLFTGAMLSAASPGRLTAALERLRVPTDIVFMAHIGMRFLPMLRHDTRHLLAAVQLRGGGTRTRRPFRPSVVTAHLLVPLVKRALRRARTVSMAAEARAYRLYTVRTQQRALRFSPVDIVVSIASVGTTAVLIAVQIR